MRIHSIIIDNFRAIEHLELRDLPDTGVVVIHGCNEAGKSTILDAIDLVLRERHTAGGKKIKVFAPAGRDEGPEVQLSATVGEYTFTIHKRWVKQKLSELTVSSPVHRNYTGREADDELARILESSMDTDLAETLFLRQGELEPGIAAAGIPSISRALDAQSGGESQGQEDSALIAAIDAEYSKYWTNASPPKEKAPYKALFTAVEEAREELLNREAQVAELAGYVEEVARRKAEIARIDSELPQAREELREREAALEAAKQVQGKMDAAVDAHQRAEENLARAKDDRTARDVLEARVGELTSERDELRNAVGPAKEARDAEREQISQLGAAVENARGHVSEARNKVERAELVRDYVRAEARRHSIKEHLGRIEEAENEFARLLESAPTREVTDADVRAIEQAENELTLQRRLRDAATAKLDITAAGAEIEVDGQVRRIEGTESVAVFDGTEVTLGQYSVVYRAPQGAENPHRAVEKAQLRLDAALSKVGCRNVEEAREARDIYAAHAAERKAARQRRDDALAGTEARELDAELSRLNSRVEEYSAKFGQSPALSEVAQGISEDDAHSQLKDAKSKLTAAERDVDAAEAALKPYAERSADKALAIVETRLENKDGELAIARAQLDAAESDRAATTLDSAVKDAAALVQETARDLRSVEAELAQAEPDLAAQLLEGASTRLANLEQRREDARNRNRELGGHIEIATGAAELADRAAAKLDAAEGALDRARRRAEAVKLLRETMHAHRDAARARYAAPFAAAIRDRAKVLFGPTVDFSLGDDLRLNARTVDGVTVPLAELSGGTKEQLALLTRFAIADLVTESGSTTPVPVVVDDALGATDPDRLARMNSLFSQVGKTSQVFVLTCFPQRFDRVAAAKTIDIDDLKVASRTRDC